MIICRMPVVFLSIVLIAVEFVFLLRFTLVLSINRFLSRACSQLLLMKSHCPMNLLPITEIKSVIVDYQNEFSDCD